MKKHELQTPAILLALDKLEHNIQSWQALCNENGKELWPMIKTHKSTALAKMQLDAGATGFLCGTLDECEMVYQLGAKHIMYAYPTANPVNIRRLLPFAKDAAATAAAAHEGGQEVLGDMPMEPMQSPFVKAGPGEITTKMSEEDMRILMDDALGHVPYATGASSFMGSRLTTDTAATRRFCEILARSGLYVLDDVTHQGSILYAEARRRGLPAWRRTLALDDCPKTEGAVLAGLKTAEETARDKGPAVANATPGPHVLAALKQWSQERDKGIRLVPLRLQPVEEETLAPDFPPERQADSAPSVGYQP